jgi:hypothetical protein
MPPRVAGTQQEIGVLDTGKNRLRNVAHRAIVTASIGGQDGPMKEVTLARLGSDPDREGTGVADDHRRRPPVALGCAPLPRSAVNLANADISLQEHGAATGRLVAAP